MARHPASLLDLEPVELTNLSNALGQPDYRARQILRAVYKRFILDPADLTDQPLAFRQALAERLPLVPVELVTEQVSVDGDTRKWLLRLPDGKTVETVLMEYNQRGQRPRRTVCISTQVGCAIGCLFCATGRAGLTRNLSAGEIVGQVLWVARHLADRDPPEAVTNIVFMGQGEPLQNLNATLTAIDRLNDPELFGLGARHITVSTSGLVPGIRALADFPLQVNLAVSLHAPNDDLRSALVPINTRYPLAQVLAACREYLEKTRRRITFEYVLIAGVNDDAKLGRELGELLRGMLCHVNVIPINPIGDDDLQRPSRERTRSFADAVAARGIPTTIRIEKGVEIAAACGQLQSERGRRGNWPDIPLPVVAAPAEHPAPERLPAQPGRQPAKPRRSVRSTQPGGRGAKPPGRRSQPARQRPAGRGAKPDSRATGRNSGASAGGRSAGAAQSRSGERRRPRGR